MISVLTTGWGIGRADALAYGVILQAVEIATAVALGLPSLVREGLTWSDLRVQALSTSPVRLQSKPPPRDAARETGLERRRYSAASSSSAAATSGSNCVPAQARSSASAASSGIALR